MGVEYSMIDGRLHGTISLGWERTTESEDGGSLGVSSYEVYTSTDGGASWALSTAVMGADLKATLPPILAPAEVSVSVRSVGVNGVRSELSPPAKFSLTGDAEAPGAPSAPALVSRLGTVTVTWDGRLAGGVPVPADFKHVEVHCGAVAAFAPTASTLMGTVVAASDSPVGGLKPGATCHVKLVAVDVSGNKSAPSAGASIVVAGVTGPDLEANAVTANSIAAGTLSAVIAEGDLFRSPVAAGKGRWEADKNGIRLYNSANQLRVNMDASTGNIASVGGTISGTHITTDALTITGGGKSLTLRDSLLGQRYKFWGDVLNANGGLNGGGTEIGNNSWYVEPNGVQVTVSNLIDVSVSAVMWCGGDTPVTTYMSFRVTNSSTGEIVLDHSFARALLLNENGSSGMRGRRLAATYRYLVPVPAGKYTITPCYYSESLGSPAGSSEWKNRFVIVIPY